MERPKNSEDVFEECAAAGCEDCSYILALEAENKRLRAIEKAARAYLAPGLGRLSPEESCKVFDALKVALDAETKNPASPVIEPKQESK